MRVVFLSVFLVLVAAMPARAWTARSSCSVDAVGGFGSVTVDADAAMWTTCFGALDELKLRSRLSYNARTHRVVYAAYATWLSGDPGGCGPRLVLAQRNSEEFDTLYELTGPYVCVTMKATASSLTQSFDMTRRIPLVERRRHCGKSGLHIWGTSRFGMVRHPIDLPCTTSRSRRARTRN